MSEFKIGDDVYNVLGLHLNDGTARIIKTKITSIDSLLTDSSQYSISDLSVFPTYEKAKEVVIKYLNTKIQENNKRVTWYETENAILQNNISKLEMRQGHDEF